MQDTVYLLAVATFMVRQSLCIAQDRLLVELGRSLYIGSTRPTFPGKGSQSLDEVLTLCSERKKGRIELQLYVVGLPDPTAG
jgi:hypothetical protein